MEEIRLLDKLRNSGCWERQGRIDGLFAHPEDSYVPALEEWLRNGSDARLRNVVMEAYRAMGCRAHTSLISLLRDGDGDVRGFAASLLGDVNDREAIGRARNRVALAKVLSMTAGAHSLLAFATDEDPEVRTEAALAIGSLGTMEAKDALLMLVNDPSEEVRTAARQTLEKFGKGDSRS